MMKTTLLIFCLFVFQCVVAGEADVLKVKVKKSRHNTYTFNVTILHKDSGWDHYVNKWEVLTLDEEIITERTLMHPHVNEQPFTRSLSGVKLPPGTESVKIRAYDSVHGYGGKTIAVELNNSHKSKLN